LPGFQVDAAMGINHSRYLDFNYLGTNIKDNQTIFAPSNTIFIAAQQLLPLPQKINMLFRMEWRHIGEQYFDLVNKIYQEPYNLFNGRITTNYKQFYLSIWCQNIFDIQYLTYAMPGYFRYSLLNRPRTFGVTLNINLKK
jgi:iron complex outermembrane receptor protein